MKAEIQGRDIAGLEEKLDQLEKVRERHAGQIASLKQSRHDEIDEKSLTIRQLTDELNGVKCSLDDVNRRHRQVRVTSHLSLATCNTCNQSINQSID